VKIVEILIIALVFCALFPTIYSTFTNPQTLNISGNASPGEYYNTYNPTVNTILTLVPLLIVIGLLYYAWSTSMGHKKGGLGI